MAIGDDFSVAANGDIRHTGTSTATYTVLELHRWLQDLADDAAATGDDLLDITTSTPSERATDNIITLNSPFNIDDAASEYFYDGSISQAGGDTLYSGLVVVGSTYGTTTLQVVQNWALYDGAAPFWGTGLNADAASNILMRCLIKTRNTGTDIDGKRILVWAREWSETYAEFSVTMGLGNAVAAIFTNNDLNNQTDETTIAAMTSIGNTEGYQLIDLGNGAGDKPYYSKWDKGTENLNDVYEYAKYIQRRGSAETVHTGISGELFRGITHEIDYDTEAGGPFTEDEEVTWGSGSTAGAGILLALYDGGTSGTLWIQQKTGAAVTAGLTITGTGSSATCVAQTGGITPRTLSPVFLGQSTGSNIIGAYGIGFESTDVTSSDTLFDLNNDPQTPPNNVTFILSGLVANQDYVLIGPKAAGNDFEFNQMLLETTLNGAAETSVVVGTGELPADAPSPSGILRIELDDGRYRRVPYTALPGSDTFTIGSTDFTHPDDATAGNDVMIAYVDELVPTGETTREFTFVFDAPRNLWIRVRDGGGSPIKTFEALGVMGAGGGSAAANRIPDV
jgi:hypothetical protein